MNNFTFSTLQRQNYLDKLRQEEFDLLIIGGGITGAGIALDAASRGMKVALVEKKDFAWGTSSRSTKLIHGGLRYLKQLEVKLVREVGLERAIVYKNALHIVNAERMLLPIVQNGSLGKSMSSLGLWVYDHLADVDKEERRRMLNKQETIKAEPLLRQDILKGGGLYYEYRTDDARLTIETLKSAVKEGATCINYAQVTGFDFSNKALPSAEIEDKHSGEKFHIKAKYIINAAGPWVDTLRAIDEEGVQGKRLHLTKGVHLVVPKERLNLQQSAYFDIVADKRMCFAIPRLNVTYIGTTDTNYKEDINTPHATIEDVEYILKATNTMFPSANLTKDDVISTWAGLRPLIHQDGKSPSELSRKDEIFISKTGLISIAGGKLTGYRKMAERVVDLVAKKLNNTNPCKTKTYHLCGADFNSSTEFDKFVNLRATSLKDLQISPNAVIALAHRYGSNLDWIIEKAYEVRPQTNSGLEAFQLAEVLYGIEFEMVDGLSDFLVRRTGRLYFERPELQNSYMQWATLLAEQLNWNVDRLKSELEDFEHDLELSMAWKKQNIKA